MEKIKTILKSSNQNITIENFTSLYTCLQEINEKEKYKKYKDDLKDIIQLIIDYLIYGDTKGDQSFFETFCELDFMSEFIKASKCKNIEILLQIIKSMSALILTINNKNSLYFIFSKNFINKLITNDDIRNSNEDFLSFYVNFLKSLSMKIDSTTIQLFYQKEKQCFPLLENAMMFYNNDDSMIRNVIKNIFLKFAKLSKEYAPLKNYLMNLPLIKYFCYFACRLTDMTMQLNYFAGYNFFYTYNNFKNYIFNYDRFKIYHDDLIDEILYIQDLLSIHDEQISSILLNSLLYYYICPLLLGSIYNFKFFFKDKKEKEKEFISYMISPQLALYILTIFITNIKNDSFLNLICFLLFKKEINTELISKFVDIHQKDKYPLYPKSYTCLFKDTLYKEKHITFVQYITYNFNQNFICSLLTEKNPKFKEIILLQKKYENAFADPEFDPYDKYDEIYKEVISKFSKKDMDFMLDYHNTISRATGIKCGISENEYEINVLKILNEEKNLGENPIRKIIFEEMFKYKEETINMNVNLLLYFLFFKMVNDEEDMNNSISKKFLYNECGLIPYELYINNNIKNIKITSKETENGNTKDINENGFKLFKTENYELKYANNEKELKNKEYEYDINLVNNLINLLQNSNPFCSLEILFIIYNIKYLLFPITNSNNENENKNNIIDEKNIHHIEFTQEQKTTLFNILFTYTQKINSLLTNIGIKYSAFESLENIWNTYHDEYSFNSKNTIIKYLLSTHFISIPSLTNNIDEYPFKISNNKYLFNTYLMGYLSLYNLIYFNNKNAFLIENGNFEYKIGNKINIETVNVHNSKFKILRILLKKINSDEFEESVIFMNKNCIIFGNEEKILDNKINNINVKYIYPLRELEICLDNSYPNSLQLYFKKNNHIIQCESDEERKDIKVELEQKRNEFIKWEQDNISNFFSTQENKFKEILEANSNNQVKTSENKNTSESNKGKDDNNKDNKEIDNNVKENKIENNSEKKEEKKEELFSWH